MEIGDINCQPLLPSHNPDAQNCCNEYITVNNIVFDANHNAYGGVSISKNMGATFTSSFFIGFNQYGIEINAGHETMITDSWFAECYWSDDNSKGCDKISKQNSTSVGVKINGNDNYLTNVIVFCFGNFNSIILSFLYLTHSFFGLFHS